MSNVKTAKAVSTDINITNNVEARAALDTFREAKLAKAEAEAALKAAEATLRETLGENGQRLIISAQPVLKLSSTRSRESLSVKAVVEVFPEAQALVKTTTYNFLEII
jgi:hypothetical protein